MARDFEAELAAARSRVERIKKAQAAAERKSWQSVGKAAFEVFGNKLLGLTNDQLKEFFSELKELKATADMMSSSKEKQASYLQPSYLHDSAEEDASDSVEDDTP